MSLLEVALNSVCPEDYVLRDKAYWEGDLTDAIENYLVSAKSISSTWSLIEVLNKTECKFVYEFLEQCRNGILTSVFFDKIEERESKVITIFDFAELMKMAEDIDNNKASVEDYGISSEEIFSAAEEVGLNPDDFEDWISLVKEMKKRGEDNQNQTESDTEKGFSPTEERGCNKIQN